MKWTHKFISLRREKHDFTQWNCSPDLLLPNSAGLLGSAAPPCLGLLWSTWHLRPAGRFAPLDLLSDNYQFAQPLLPFASSLSPAAKFRNFPPLVTLDWQISPADSFRSAWPLPCARQLLQMTPCHIRWKEYECSRNNTHSNLQPSTVMLRQPVLGSFQPVTPALVTTGTRITPLTMLPSLHQQCFPSTSTTRICTYSRNNSFPTIAQHFHTRLFRHPAYVCTKCHPALS